MKNCFFVKMRAMVLGLSLGLLMIGATQAALVMTTVSGEVDFAEASNPFGLTLGDSVTAVATYDNAGIPGAGDFTIEVNSFVNPLLALTMTFGTHTFLETDDADFQFGGPELLFTDGLLSGIGFFQELGAGNFDSLELGSTDGDGIEDRFFLDDVGVDPFNTLLEGEWDFANATTVPVNSTPITEPGIILLLSIGLLGLITRRRHLSI